MTNTVFMFDDTDVSKIPADAPAVACYGDGRYTNAAAVKKLFPHIPVVVIDVASYYRNGDVLDVEPGDATNVNAPKWFKATVGKTEVLPKPAFYTSASNVPALISALAAAGIQRSQYLLWSAHYNYAAHLCGHGCGYPQTGEVRWTADATQWTDKAQGKSLDESLVTDGFFGVNAGPKPVPAPTPKPTPKPQPAPTPKPKPTGPAPYPEIVAARESLRAAAAKKYPAKVLAQVEAALKALRGTS